MLTTPIPETLRALVTAHGSSYSPRYSAAALSDHGPMACLALHGLGIGESRIQEFAAEYRPRLAPLRQPSVQLDVGNWYQHRGRSDSYEALREFFSGEIRERGYQATLGRYLPTLISGWVPDLFHPLIRLAYGIEFGVPSEIAAGLAYLATVGDAPRLALAARHPPLTTDGRAYLMALSTERDPDRAEGPTSFNQKLSRVMDRHDFRPARVDRSAATELTRACLEVFHATHDFFALHLVTGSHAFGVCAPWIGEHADGLFSVGIGAAYVAIGAPTFAPIAAAAGALRLDKLATATDEHDIKLAYTCRALGRTTGDPTYEWVAERYLATRL
jgi:hypothetical protein